MTEKKANPKTYQKSPLKKIELEYEIKSSPKVLFTMLSTPSGLEEWFADKVNPQGDNFVFEWEGEKKEAKVVAKKDSMFIRFKWLSDEYHDTYFEFTIVQDEMTSDVALVVTDFTSEEDRDETIMLWNSQIADLRHVVGS
ncbi:MAG TPA: START-like domain-containing protein [Bacteroidia bacterium]|nr:START-like domain-containing protein [Bacteroidia bacterium]